jgi:predicted alpha/beta hydrolase family esterase/diadenosine tetraphosphate (Ap4A) HIT family hydrolase
MCHNLITMARILVIPGYGGSGPDHWQTLWERLDGRCLRVEQGNWDSPELEGWLAALDQVVAAQRGPVVLVAHSLGCVLLAHWVLLARRSANPQVVGALLVAPADVDDRSCVPACLGGFAPIPRAPLPFPSILVASRNDSYCSFARAQQLASSWGARLVDAGALGHVNADSRLGTWPLGRALLQELLASAPFELDARLAADTVPLAESGLSLLLLMNDSRYPWLIVVPKVAGVSELFELDEDDRSRLWEESGAIARCLGHDFAADKVNVAMLGNVVRQLHVHHVARRLDDPAWPGPVWGHSPRVPYAVAQIAALRARLAAGRLREWFRFD